MLEARSSRTILPANAAKELGLYLHVPFCAALCHYCDFAKTANFSHSAATDYLKALSAHTRLWLEYLSTALGDFNFTSVFLGGGTPSLFTDAYEELFDLIRPFSRSAEISMEANPDDIDGARLRSWRELGVNRLSLGVQTFNEGGLNFLKRTHNGDKACQAIELALAEFGNVNVDLIYGWSGQSASIWQEDLDTVLKLGVPHLSLYTLTYEPRTPLGRAMLRGKLKASDDDELADRYFLARERLAGYGYEHEEVSNWSKAGYSCRHNWLYWKDKPYIGIGAGAHGYLSSDEGIGCRYAYRREEKHFRHFLSEAQAGLNLEDDLTAMFGVEVEHDRTSESWLIEYVGSGLRTKGGINITEACARTQKVFTPRPAVAEGLAQAQLSWKGEGLLFLSEEEWYRETTWALEVLRSFR